VEWLTDRKWAHIRLEGRTFGDVPLNIEMKLEVWDSPNSAGVVIDAVRCCKLALENKISGSLHGPSSYFMKSPPEQYRDDIARDKTEEFIQKYGRIVDLGGNGKKPKKAKAKTKVAEKPKSRLKKTARSPRPFFYPSRAVRNPFLTVTY
jgi:myo-inositol-1-phosphate synthase